MTDVHTILGAGGAIGTELCKILIARPERVRLVARNPPEIERAEDLSADVSNLEQTLSAVAGSSVVYLVVGLKYDVGVWREFWPKIMRNVIDACKHARASLVFFDNVYMYGQVSGAMTETTPFNPCSEKGEIRARVATMLLDEMRKGNLRALIARSADFYGPGVRTGVPNILVFDALAKGNKASWLADDSVPHSFTFTPDAAASLAMLASSDAAWNQTWHVPTASRPPTAAEFIRMAAGELGAGPHWRVLGPTMLTLAGLFDHNVRELREMLYQYDAPYVFDSTKFDAAFGFEPTSYAEGIRRIAATYKGPRGG